MNAVKSFHVSGKMPMGERTAEIDRFLHERQSVITNARCLTEGVDIPEVDAVLFADPKSKIDIVQAAGRALRKQQVSNGYIIIPAIIDQKSLNAGNELFKQIINVVSALGMHDERIMEEYDLLVNGIKRDNPLIEFNVPKLIELILKTVQEINIRVWDRLVLGGIKDFHIYLNMSMNLGHQE